jgi:hypothetical protein
MTQYISLDTEGTDIKKTDYRAGTGYATGISIACRPVDTPDRVISAYFPVRHTEDNIDANTLTELTKLIETHPRIIMHNAKHDIVALDTIGIKRKQFYCTLLMIHFLHENLPSKTLDAVSKFILGDEGKQKSAEWEFWLAAVGWGPEFPARVMAEYACHDAELPLLIFEKIYKKFKAEGFDG